MGHPSIQDEVVIDSAEVKIWTDADGNQHTTTTATEIHVGGEESEVPGIRDVTQKITTRDANGNMESQSRNYEAGGGADRWHNSKADILMAVKAVGVMAIDKAMRKASDGLASHFVSSLGKHPGELALRGLDIAAVLEGGPIGAVAASAHAVNDIYNAIENGPDH